MYLEITMRKGTYIPASPAQNQTLTITVANDGSGNVFVVNGTNKPVLNFVRGSVITFVQSDATNATHPIAIKDGSGNSYTTGVVSTGTPGSAGAQTVFTVASNAPSDLRYYCTVHGNAMGAIINVSTSSVESFADAPCYFPAEQFVQEVRFKIGTQTVDTHTSEYFRVRSELFDTPETAAAYRRLTDFVDSEPAGSVKTMFLPLRFSMCDPGRALPLIAMPNTQASLEFTFASSVAGIDSTYNPDVKLWAEYTYLDAEDRRILAMSDLDLPFEQIQVHEESARVTASTQTVRLPFRNAVKWLAWTCADPSSHGVFSGGVAGEKNPAIGIVATSTLTFNSHERVRGSAAFFNVLQPTMSLGRAPCAGLYMYPFASDMTSLASTGSANFTIIDVVILALTFKRITEATLSTGLASQDETIANASRLTRLRVYAASWNVLRFTQGECGLAYV